MSIGQFKEVRRSNGNGYKTCYEDNEIDAIHDTLDEVVIDVKNKIEELHEEYSKWEDKYKEVQEKIHDFELTEPDDIESKEHDDWENQYNDLQEESDEYADKCSAIDDAGDELNDILDKLDPYGGGQY